MRQNTETSTTSKPTSPLKRLLAGAGLILLGAVTLAGTQVIPLGKPTTRQVTLEARGAAFSDTNPTIEARVGERIRIRVRNTDPGVLHAIAVPELSPKVQEVKWGETAELEVTATAPGTYEYKCPQHCPLMRGKIVVRP